MAVEVSEKGRGLQGRQRLACSLSDDLVKEEYEIAWSLIEDLFVETSQPCQRRAVDVKSLHGRALGVPSRTVSGWELVAKIPLLRNCPRFQYVGDVEKHHARVLKSFIMVFIRNDNYLTIS